MPVKIYHFHNGSGGGVLSVIRNLLLYRQHSEIENHIIYTINKDISIDFQVPGLKGAASEQVFYYSPKWNFYHTCRQLAKLLPDDKAIIVAHDWLELGMVSNLGLQNPVVHYVHGAYNYYYELAVKHNSIVDSFIVVAQKIADELCYLLPKRKANIHYLRFPVPNVKCKTHEKSPGFHVVFAGRCEVAKGYTLLPEIDIELQLRGVKVQWHIAGQGSTDASAKQIWPCESDVVFHGLLKTDELEQLLCQSHIFLLPSIAEGMPLSVIEAMKAGAVPIVNDLPGGMQEIIKKNETGYLIENNKISSYAVVIKNLFDDESLLRSTLLKAQSEVNQLFNPISNTFLIEEIFLKTKHVAIQKISEKSYGSRLDQFWLPNKIVNFLRSL